MRKLMKALAVASLLMFVVGIAHAFDLAGLMKEIGVNYYKKYYGPVNVFSYIKCDRCDMSTEWLVEADMSAFNANEVDFLQLEKLLNRDFRYGDLLELCNGAKCAVYVYNGKASFAGRPWTLMKAAYKDTHTRYRNVSFHFDEGGEVQRNYLLIGGGNPYSIFPQQQSEGSVKFPPEIWCPGPYCQTSVMNDMLARFAQNNDTLILTMPLSVPPPPSTTPPVNNVDR